jgi:hypothetical protein
MREWGAFEFQSICVVVLWSAGPADLAVTYLTSALDSMRAPEGWVGGWRQRDETSS